MREIKLRGYAVEEMVNSQWIYGTGLHKIIFTDEYAERTGIKEEWFIFTDSGWEQVVPKSVGQYTGMNDISNIEIYEGDLVEHEMEVNGTWEAYEACKIVFDSDVGIYCFDWDSPNLLSDYRNLKVVGKSYKAQ